MLFKGQLIKFIYFSIDYVKKLDLETFIILFIKSSLRYAALTTITLEKESSDTEYKFIEYLKIDEHNIF